MTPQELRARIVRFSENSKGLKKRLEAAKKAKQTVDKAA